MRAIVSAPYEPPARRSDVDNVSDLSLGQTTACAARSDGTALCWGGVIQHPSGVATAYSNAVKVPAPEAIVRISADDALGCALGQSGALYCWRGMGSFPYEVYPGPPPFPELLVAEGMPNLVDVEARDGRVCGVTAEGGVWCMQETPDELGQLPTGPFPQPVQVEGIGDARSVVVSYGATCAITARGLACWGEVPFLQGPFISNVPVPLDF